MSTISLWPSRFSYDPLKHSEIRVIVLHEGAHFMPLECSLVHIPLHHAKLSQDTRHLANTVGQGLSQEDALRLLQRSESNDFRNKNTLDHDVLQPITRETLEHYQLDDTHSEWSSKYREYEAVSYTWGASSKPCQLFCRSVISSSGERVVSRNNNMICITANLDAALRKLRLAQSDRVFWADAVCINQEDLQERSEQVLLMRKIFAYARRTLVWLYEDTYETGESLECIRLIRTKYANLQLTTRLEFLEALTIADKKPWMLKRRHPGYIQESLWKSFERMLSRPWFSRVWVCQEVVVSFEVLVIYGASYIDWNDLLEASSLVKDFDLNMSRVGHQPLHHSVLSMSEVTPWRLELDQHGFSTVKWRGTIPPPAFNSDASFARLDNVLTLMSAARATDARDKVYALLGISSGFDKTFLVPDYTLSLVETYIKAAETLQRMEDLPPLKFLSFVEHESSALSQDFPSWVPDWTRDIRSNFIGNIKFRAASSLPCSIQFPNRTPDRHNPGINMSFLLAIKGVTAMRITAFRRRSAGRTEGDILIPSSTLYPTTHLHYREVIHEGMYPNSLIGTLIPPSARTSKFWDHYRKCQAEGIYAPSLYSLFYREEDAEPDVDIIAWDRKENVQGIAHGRRSFVTDLGFIGLAPLASKVGDEICVLFGGSVPFVIRRDGKYCRFVGECYVYGIMNGEVLEELDESQIEDFLFY